ncbi:RIP metalloprotease RseP [Candidatus Peregrinibacteria bacterium CG11_big_fil_rev_8_21_14_0_20_46_8]|nr:MAG: RIP metalloprotease RseP [Candidatus Peregrinibacteria bacterium CG11_big_fil_rev_8_21_14_0_20_46_8]
MIFLTILAVIIIFSVLVLIHEYGHFAAARRAGIKVLEFGIGFPPRLYGKKIGETEYTINAIPFGGFVKLFGEDATDPKILANKRSFAAQSTWVRTKVVVAGVVMNLLLAVVLLTVGFMFGIEPLLVTQEDIFTHIESGVVQTAPGVYVAKVDEQVSGVDAGDRIVAINGEPVNDIAQIAPLRDKTAQSDIDVTLESQENFQRRTVHLPILEDGSFGLELKPLTPFPRLIVQAVEEGSAAQQAGLRSGDIILTIHDEEIFFPEDLHAALADAGSGVQMQVLRGDEPTGVKYRFDQQARVVIADVFAGSVAEEIGLQRGDIITTINTQDIHYPQEVQQMIEKSNGTALRLQIQRQGQEELLEKTITLEPQSRLGIALDAIDSYKNADFSFFRTSVVTSLLEVGKVQYSPGEAIRQALSESVRLTGLTIKAFGRTLGSLVSQFTVPADVGGPVQIAYYTHTFIQEGFFALLRFTALLSLSLAVINILPIPALDGGRFLFILIEVVFRRRVNARLEAIVHTIGFMLLLGLIALVTYSDIVKLF